MFNNYKKMHEMESVIASVLPEGRIKEAKAGVWPIEEKFPKVTVGEKPSFVTPETMREAAETETAVISSEAPENVPEETALMETEEADAPAYKVYTVGEGETLYGICFKVYQNVNKLDEICRINSLRNYANACRTGVLGRRTEIPQHNDNSKHAQEKHHDSSVEP